MSRCTIRMWRKLLILILLLHGIFHEVEGKPAGSMAKLINLSISCEQEGIKVNMEFDGPFDGIVFSKGYFRDPSCRYVPAGSGQDSYAFTVPFNSCGTTVPRSDGPSNSFDNEIIIQNDPAFQEIWDSARKLRCVWSGNLEKLILFKPFTVKMLESETVQFLGQDMVECWMDIQRGNYPEISPLNGVIDLGEQLTMLIYVKDEHQNLDVMVKECWSYNSPDLASSFTSKFQLTDEQGCPLKKKFINPWQKVYETTSSGPAVVAYTNISAFKFPDQREIYMSCNIQVCPDQCTDVQPCTEQDRSVSQPASRPINNLKGNDPNNAITITRLVNDKNIKNVKTKVTQVAGLPNQVSSRPGYMPVGDVGIDTADNRRLPEPILMTVKSELGVQSSIESELVNTLFESKRISTVKPGKSQQNRYPSEEDETEVPDVPIDLITQFVDHPPEITNPTFSPDKQVPPITKKDDIISRTTPSEQPRTPLFTKCRNCESSRTTPSEQRITSPTKCPHCKPSRTTPSDRHTPLSTKCPNCEPSRTKPTEKMTPPSEQRTPSSTKCPNCDPPRITPPEKLTPSTKCPHCELSRTTQSEQRTPSSTKCPNCEPSKTTSSEKRTSSSTKCPHCKPSRTTPSEQRPSTSTKCPNCEPSRTTPSEQRTPSSTKCPNCEPFRTTPSEQRTPSSTKCPHCDPSKNTVHRTPDVSPPTHLPSFPVIVTPPTLSQLSQKTTTIKPLQAFPPTFPPSHKTIKFKQTATPVTQDMRVTLPFAKPPATPGIDLPQTTTTPFRTLPLSVEQPSSPTSHPILTPPGKPIKTSPSVAVTFKPTPKLTTVHLPPTSTLRTPTAHRAPTTLSPKLPISSPGSTLKTVLPPQPPTLQSLTIPPVRPETSTEKQPPVSQFTDRPPQTLPTTHELPFKPARTRPIPIPPTPPQQQLQTQTPPPQSFSPDTTKPTSKLITTKRPTLRTTPLHDTKVSTLIPPPFSRITPPVLGTLTTTAVPSIKTAQPSTRFPTPSPLPTLQPTLRFPTNPRGLTKFTQPFEIISIKTTESRSTSSSTIRSPTRPFPTTLLPFPKSPITGSPKSTPGRATPPTRQRTTSHQSFTPVPSKIPPPPGQTSRTVPTIRSFPTTPKPISKPPTASPPRSSPVRPTPPTAQRTTVRQIFTSTPSRLPPPTGQPSRSRPSGFPTTPQPSHKSPVTSLPRGISTPPAAQRITTDKPKRITPPIRPISSPPLPFQEFPTTRPPVNIIDKATPPTRQRTTAQLVVRPTPPKLPPSPPFARITTAVPSPLLPFQKSPTTRPPVNIIDKATPPTRQRTTAQLVVRPTPPKLPPSPPFARITTAVPSPLLPFQKSPTTRPPVNIIDKATPPIRQRTTARLVVRPTPPKLPPSPPFARITTAVPSPPLPFQKSPTTRPPVNIIDKATPPIRQRTTARLVVRPTPPKLPPSPPFARITTAVPSSPPPFQKSPTTRPPVNIIDKATPPIRQRTTARLVVRPTPPKLPPSPPFARITTAVPFRPTAVPPTTLQTLPPPKPLPTFKTPPVTPKPFGKTSSSLPPSRISQFTPATGSPTTKLPATRAPGSATTTKSRIPISFPDKSVQQTPVREYDSRYHAFHQFLYEHGEPGARQRFWESLRTPKKSTRSK